MKIKESPIEKRSDIHLRFYYPCNAILIFLGMEEGNEFFLSKREVIDTLISVFNDLVKET